MTKIKNGEDWGHPVKEGSPEGRARPRQRQGRAEGGDRRWGKKAGRR